MNLEFKYSFRDTLDVQNLLPKIRYGQWIVVAVGSFLVLSGFAILIYGRGQQDPIITLLFGVIWLLLGFFARYLSAIGAWCFDTPKGAFKLAITERALEGTCDGLSLIFNWNQLTHVHESSKIILLHHKKYKSFFAIPKRVFSEMDQAQFRQWLPNILTHANRECVDQEEHWVSNQMNSEDNNPSRGELHDGQ